ncbi:hypothetical protein HK405_001537 [Cladochytrium tenue]|nr:hypothetical protein HK405_001537 [Cladochytrium tenue]
MVAQLITSLAVVVIVVSGLGPFATISHHGTSWLARAAPDSITPLAKGGGSDGKGTNITPACMAILECCRNAEEAASPKNKEAAVMQQRPTLPECIMAVEGITQSDLDDEAAESLCDLCANVPGYSAERINELDFSEPSDIGPFCGVPWTTGSTGYAAERSSWNRSTGSSIGRASPVGPEKSDVTACGPPVAHAEQPRAGFHPSADFPPPPPQAHASTLTLLLVILPLITRTSHFVLPERSTNWLSASGGGTLTGYQKLAWARFTSNCPTSVIPAPLPRRPGAESGEEAGLLAAFFALDPAVMPRFVHPHSLDKMCPLLRISVYAAGTLLADERRTYLATRDAFWYFRIARKMVLAFGTGTWQMLGLAVEMALLLKLDIDHDDELSPSNQASVIASMSDIFPFLSKTPHTSTSAVGPIASDATWLLFDPTSTLQQPPRASPSDNITNYLVRAFDTFAAALDLLSHPPANDAALSAAESAIDTDLLAIAASVPNRFTLTPREKVLAVALSSDDTDTDPTRRIVLFLALRGTLAVLTRHRSLRFLEAMAVERSAASALGVSDTDPHRTAPQPPPHLRQYAAAFHRGLAAAGELAQMAALLRRLLEPQATVRITRVPLIFAIQCGLSLTAARPV